jgi:hypothetical protein
LNAALGSPERLVIAALTADHLRVRAVASLRVPAARRESPGARSEAAKRGQSSSWTVARSSRPRHSKWSSPSMTKLPPLIIAAVIVGLTLLALAVLYFIDSADSLPLATILNAKTT